MTGTSPDARGAGASVQHEVSIANWQVSDAFPHSLQGSGRWLLRHLHPRSIVTKWLKDVSVQPQVILDLNRISGKLHLSCSMR